MPPARDIGAGDVAAGPYDDQIAFMRDAGALAESLLSEGYTAMKIWPLDIYAAASGGQMITLSELKTGLEPFRRIRAAVGDRIEVMCELHSLWSCQCRDPHLPGRWRISASSGPRTRSPRWATSRRWPTCAGRPRVPICGSETLGGAVPFRQMLEAEAVDFVMLDIAWCGGLTEGRKIAALAEAFAKPLAPHDCTGPVTLMAGAAAGDPCADRDLPGGGAGDAGHLVPRPRHRPADHQGRPGPGTDRAGPWHQPAAGGKAARGCDHPRIRHATDAGRLEQIAGGRARPDA